MGVGHLDIAEGRGDAGVFNPNPAIQMYGQLLAQRKAKQEAENVALASTLAKGYDPNGLRNDADRQSYINQYNAIKTAGINSANEKDPMKKALALAEVRQQLANLGQYADKSKHQGIQEQAWANHYMANPHEWGDDAIGAYRKSKDAAIGTPDVIGDFTTLQRRVDPTKMATLLKNHSDLMLKNSPVTYDNGVVSPEQIVEGKKQRQVTQNRVIPFADALESTLHLASVDHDYQKYLSDAYKDIQGANEAETRALRVKQDLINQGYGGGFRDKPIMRTVTAAQEPQPDRYYAHRDYAIAHPTPNALLGNQLTPVQTLIINMQQGVPGSGEKLIALTPQGQYGVQKPKINIDKTGNHIFHFPEHIDQKAKVENDVLKAKFAKEYPKEEYDPTAMGYSKLKPETIKPAKDYILNPNSPDYAARAAQMASEQNINLGHLNQIESVKGGHGQIEGTKGSTKSPTVKLKIPNVRLY